MSRVTFGTAECGSGDYRAILRIREEIMRKPIGLSLSAQDTADDAASAHVWLKVGGVITGTAKLVPLDDNTLKLRMMAVLPWARGTGIGRLVARFCEGYAAGRGYTRIVLDARLTVEGFYQKLGYEALGDIFEQVGIPHVFMSKDLTTTCPSDCIYM